LKHAIASLPADISLQKCFNSDGSNPTYSITNFYCALITRNPSGTIGNADRPTVNLGGYKTSGYDVQATWKAGLGDFGLDDRFGSVGLDVVVSRLRTFKIQDAPGG